MVVSFMLSKMQRHFFLKVKADLLKERTLPIPELLAVQLALKYFIAIFNDGLMKEVTFSDINLFVDSQVVLYWILTCKAPQEE